MKLKALSVAVAATVVASQAMAITFSEQATPDAELNFSGATAVDKQFISYVDQTCTAGTIDVFTNSDDSASAYYCTVDASILGTTKNVLIRKASGGSSQGVTPVSHGLAAEGQVEALDLTTCTETTPRSAGVDGQWDCSNTTTTVQSQVGISDVEPAMFSLTANQKPTLDKDGNGDLILDGAGNATVLGTEGGPIAANLSVFPANVQTFGIVVSPALRDALQTAQGLTAGSDDVDDMPSMSSQLVANLLAGNIDSWSVLKDANGNALSSEEVNVCLRRPGSGTQAQANAFYMGLGCAYRGGSGLSYAGLSPAIDPDGQGKNGFEIQETDFGFFTQPVSAPYIFWNDGSSDMGKCVSAISRAETWSLNEGGDQTDPADYTVTQIRGGDTGWAIGIQSIEKVKETKVDRNYFKYVAIDGVTPTLENVAAGLYKNVASASIQWNNSVVTGGDELTLAQRFVNLAQGVSTVATANASLQVAGTTPQITDGGSPINVGSLAFAQGTVVAEVPFNAANPVIPFNKGLVGPSTCAISNFEGAVLDATQQN